MATSRPCPAQGASLILRACRCSWNHRVCAVDTQTLKFTREKLCTFSQNTSPKSNAYVFKGIIQGIDVVYPTEIRPQVFRQHEESCEEIGSRGCNAPIAEAYVVQICLAQVGVESLQSSNEGTKYANIRNKLQ